MSAQAKRFSGANIAFGVLGWAVALLMFLPLIWLVVTG